MDKLAVVVVGYNRVDSISRLLGSLCNANYGGDHVDLIISLDNCGKKHVERYAKKFEWKHGNKVVRTFPSRQGLRRHIISCGEYLKHYDAIVVLEDDIVVSPEFYNFTKQAVDFYKESSEIAGISLYKHQFNINNQMPFIPAPGAHDVFFMQIAQSWGQIWMKKQWTEFYEWYCKNYRTEIANDNVPNTISSWPESSWLKYHIKYCIEKGKYFAYPYNSLTTCFSDVGEHCLESSNRFQVPLVIEWKDKYKFVDPDKKDVIRYDSFFERENLDFSP